ncbi:MAG: tetratricopeptide repeat protein [Deltaproteobacteria bacterium]|nr:tetratricopeptide repeat protein [Deltaproteobacteria bacterium]
MPAIPDAKLKLIYRLIPPALIAAVTLGVYASTLLNGFVYDDNHILLSNIWVTDFRYAPDILFSPLMSFDAAKTASNTYRPLLFFLFMAEHYVFGFKPLGFHLVNIVLHAANAVLVYYLAGFFLKGSFGEGEGDRGRLTGTVCAVFAGLVFSLHTVNTEVVNWVSAQAELTYTFFTLASFNIFIRAGAGRRTGLMILSALFFLLALFCKETAAALLPIIFLYGLTEKGRGPVKGWKGYLLFVLTFFAFMAIRTYAIGGIIHHKQADLGIWSAVVNVFPLVAGYFSKLVYPSGLNILYEFHPARGLSDIRVIAGIAITIAFMVCAVFFRRRRPVYTALVVAAVPLLPVLYIPALSTAASADRYLYLPSVGFAILLAYLCGQALKRRGTAVAAVFVSVILLAAYSVASIERGRVWRDDYSLWADALKKSPNNPNVHYNFAWASHGKGDFGNAIAHYSETIRLDKGAADAHYNLGVIYAYRKDTKEAAFEFREALKINPGYKEAADRLLEIQSGSLQ